MAEKTDMTQPSQPQQSATSTPAHPVTTEGTAAKAGAGTSATKSTPTQHKAAQQKSVEHHSGAQEGARSVAEAVKRVTDAAVAEISKVEAPAPGDFIFTGTPGGKFRIDGPNGKFSTNGTVKVNGVQVLTTGWSSMRIEGVLPAGITGGEVTVQIDKDTIFYGTARF